MASTTPTTSSNNKEIVAEVPPYIRAFNDGIVERSIQSPFMPALLDDPQTGILSKDIVICLISHNPAVSVRLHLPKLTKPNNQDQAEKVPILVYFHGGILLRICFLPAVPWPFQLLCSPSKRYSGFCGVQACSREPSPCMLP